MIGVLWENNCIKSKVNFPHSLISDSAINHSRQSPLRIWSTLGQQHLTYLDFASKINSGLPHLFFLSVESMHYLQKSEDTFASSLHPTSSWNHFEIKQLVNCVKPLIQLECITLDHTVPPLFQKPLSSIQMSVTLRTTDTSQSFGRFLLEIFCWKVKNINVIEYVVYLRTLEKKRQSHVCCCFKQEVLDLIHLSSIHCLNLPQSEPLLLELNKTQTMVLETYTDVNELIGSETISKRNKKRKSIEIP